MRTVFLDAQGIILCDFLKPGVTVSSERYIKTLIKLKTIITRTRSEKKKTFFSQYDATRPHASHKTAECVTKFGWTVLPYPPYYLELAQTNLRLFGPLKKDCGDSILLTIMLSQTQSKNGPPQLEENFISATYMLPFIVGKNALKLMITLKNKILEHNMCLI